MRFLKISGERMRMVTHHQVDDVGVDRAVAALADALRDPERAVAEADGSASAGRARRMARRVAPPTATYRRAGEGLLAAGGSAKPTPRPAFFV